MPGRKTREKQCKMSVDYASRLSDYEDKGVCGTPEVSVDSTCMLCEKYLTFSGLVCVVDF